MSKTKSEDTQKENEEIEDFLNRYLEISIRPSFIQSLKDIFFPSIVAIAIYFAANKFAPTDIVPASTKPFADFNSFYPFYLSQHQDGICRTLHYIGTALLILIAAWDSSVAYGMLMGTAIGYAVMPFTRGLEHGFLDMLIVSITYQISVRYVCRGSKLATIAPLFAYLFAWFGHFIFEKNKPATFIYPVYSYMGDFRMFYDLLKAHFHE